MQPMDNLATEGSCWYTISGINPEPWAASEGAVGKRGGKTFIHFHKPQQLRQYQESIKEEFPTQNPQAVEITGDIELVFYFWRQLPEYELTEKDSRKRRSHQADATNLQKALEDALQGLVYKNDRDIRSIRSVIVAQSAHTSPFILIRAGQYTDKAELVSAEIRRGELEADSPAPVSNEHDLDVEGIF